MDADTLKAQIGRKKASVKRAKASLKAAPAADKPMRKRVLKSMKTKLNKAQAAYSKSKPKGKIHKTVDEAATSVKRFPFKCILSWTGLAIATAATAIGGFFIYDKMANVEEAPITADEI